jgi:hypothetical protein
MKVIVRSLFVIAVLTIVIWFAHAPIQAHASEYVALQFDASGNLATAAPAVDYTWNGIPFYFNPEVDVRSPNLGGPLSAYIPIDIQTLGFTSISGLHFSTWSGESTCLPDGIPMADITAHYASGCSNTVTMILGVNTAEWAYDRPGISEYVAHTKIPGFYSYLSGGYPVHRFYANLDGISGDQLIGVSLTLRPESYTQPPGSWPWSAQGLNGITLEGTSIPEPRTIALIASALLSFAGIAFRKMRKG